MASLLKSILLLLQLSGRALALPRDDNTPALTTTSVSTQTSLELRHETLAVRLAPDTSFTQSCKDMRLDMADADKAKTPRLAAKCQDKYGKERCASIKLNNCIANREGSLSWARDRFSPLAGPGTLLTLGSSGNFHTSCRECNLDTANGGLVCMCNNIKGGADNSLIKLRRWNSAPSPTDRI
ncbi:unnamed protein product [Clonostachys solani]|uniref:Cyanovirin-N domain-containing protein n=1 Tax=Clonostachys solani TaxID=160281 RepID=A0A9N9W2U1_9HYPO|nr:unnamed protein product [Clonostachys solani]